MQKLVKPWIKSKYLEIHTHTAHSGALTRSAFSPGFVATPKRLLRWKRMHGTRALLKLLGRGVEMGQYRI